MTPKVNILLVDDRPENLMAIETVLDRPEYHLIKAHSGPEALRCTLQEEEIAVVILDVKMPGMDGFETASMLRARDKTRHVPIIFLTAHSRNEEQVLQGYTLGAVDYLLKPPQPQTLRAKVAVFVELYKAKASLRDTLTLQRAILDGANYAIISTDPAGRVATFNRAAESMLGYVATEVLGQTTPALWHDGAEVARRAEELSGELGCRVEPGFETLVARARQGDPDENEWTFIRKDGSHFPALLSVTALRDPDKNITGFLGVVADITGRKHAEEERLRQINEELRRKNSELEQFMFTVTHDLKSPLVTIQGFAGHCQQDVRAGQWDRLPEFLDRVQAAADRMTRLIGDLLDLSQIGRVANRPVLVAMTDLVSGVVRSHEERFRQRGVRVTVQHNMPLVRVDTDRMVQVFDNLIGNALIHGCDADDPCIEVGARVCDGECRFFVRDNGPGIPAAHRERIFEVFQRLSKDRDGTGIGLAIVRRIVEFHGGRSWVESSENQGATFWVALPQHRLEAPERPLARQEEAYEIGTRSTG